MVSSTSAPICVIVVYFVFCSIRQMFQVFKAGLEGKSHLNPLNSVFVHVS